MFPKKCIKALYLPTLLVAVSQPQAAVGRTPKPPSSWTAPTLMVPPLLSWPSSSAPPFPNSTTSTPADTSPTWITVPISQLTGDPFCSNYADPHHGVGNHCVCKNGVTLSIIPFTSGANYSDYQPCAYTTVEGNGSANGSAISTFGTGTTVWVGGSATSTTSVGGNGNGSNDGNGVGDQGEVCDDLDES